MIKLIRKIVMDEELEQNGVMNEEIVKNFTMNAKIDPKVVMDLFKNCWKNLLMRMNFGC